MSASWACRWAPAATSSTALEISRIEVCMVSDFSATPSAISFTFTPNFCISFMRIRILASMSLRPFARIPNSSLLSVQNSWVRSPCAARPIPSVIDFTALPIFVAILLPVTKAITQARRIMAMVRFRMECTSSTILFWGISPQSIIPVSPAGANTYKYFSPPYST